MSVGVDALRTVYNRTVREHLPRKYRLLAGVAVYDAAMLDVTVDLPQYKAGLMNAIRTGIETGDRVELVGFGRGVSTVHCLRAGADTVVAYEAAEEMIELGTHTLEANLAGDGRVIVRHALVGDGVDVYGDAADAEAVSPETLCDADVLVLDCEGAEVSILEGLGTYPDTIICEAHPDHGATTERLRSLLEPRYDVTTYAYHPERTEKDVLLARR